MILTLASILVAASPLADIGTAPPTALIDTAGRPFALDSLKGKAVVVSFIYTTCNGTCPATTHTLYRVQEKLKEIASERKDKAIALLTDDQKAKFKQLQGQKFDTSTVQPARGSFKNSGRINGPNLLPPPGQQPGA